MGLVCESLIKEIVGDVGSGLVGLYIRHLIRVLYNLSVVVQLLSRVQLLATP